MVKEDLIDPVRDLIVVAIDAAAEAAAVEVDVVETAAALAVEAAAAADPQVDLLAVGADALRHDQKAKAQNSAVSVLVRLNGPTPP